MVKSKNGVVSIHDIIEEVNEEFRHREDTESPEYTEAVLKAAASFDANSGVNS